LNNDLSVRIVGFTNAIYKSDIKTRIIQTRPYRAPEVLLGLTFNDAADIWSLGCLTYRLLTGEYLFAPKPGSRSFQNEEHLALIFRLNKKISRVFLNSSPQKHRYFDKNFNLKNFTVHPKTSISKKLADNLQASHRTIKELSKILKSCLRIVPSERQTASVLLNLYCKKADNRSNLSHYQSFGIGVRRGLRNELGTLNNDPLQKPLEHCLCCKANRIDSEQKAILENEESAKNPYRMISQNLGKDLSKDVSLTRNPFVIDLKTKDVQSKGTYKIEDLISKTLKKAKDRVRSTSHSSHQNDFSSSDLSVADTEDNQELMNEFKFATLLAMKENLYFRNGSLNFAQLKKICDRSFVNNNMYIGYNDGIEVDLLDIDDDDF